MSSVEAGREEDSAKQKNTRAEDQGQKSPSPAQEGKARGLERGLRVGVAGGAAAARLWRSSSAGVGAVRVGGAHGKLG